MTVHHLNLKPKPAPQFDHFQMKCAGCGWDCTHHYKVEVFALPQKMPALAPMSWSRPASRSLTTNDAETGNPSSRRDGVRILMTCEECDALTAIEIIQHKGTTYLSTKKVLD
jgi:hypothetical protein